MVHRLIGRELRNRGQHAISICRQHDDVFWHRAHIVFGRVRDEIDRIRPTAIFSQARVIEIELPCFRVHHDIFKHSTKALGRRKNFRFGFGRKPYHFGVTAAFEIEDRSVRPAMLIVADQCPRSIRAERRLARTRKSKENRSIAIRADIGRAMHRHNALYRQQIIEDAENRLLHLTGISCAADQDQFLTKIDCNHRLAAAAVARRVGAEAR